MQRDGWAARIRAASMADDALGTLLAHRGVCADMFLAPGRSLQSLQCEKYRRSISVADFRRQEDRPSRQEKHAGASNGRHSIKLKVPKRTAVGCIRPPHPSDLPTPHPVALPRANSDRPGPSVQPRPKHDSDDTRAVHDMSFVLDDRAESSAKSARFVAHQESAKYGRAWGKYNPIHLPIVQGVPDVEGELNKPNFGCRELLRACKMDIAKLNDRRSGNMAVRDAAGTLHSTLSYSAYDPYGRYKETYNAEWSGRLGGGSESSIPAKSKPKTMEHGSTQPSGRPSGGTKRSSKRLAGRGTMRVHIPMGDEGAGDVPTYNVTNAIAAGLPSTQILNRSILLSRTGDFEDTLGFAGGAVWQ